MSLPQDITDLIDNLPAPGAAQPQATGMSMYKPPAAGGAGGDELDNDPIFTRLVASIRHVESGGNPNAISPQGASGSMQIMPGTFAQYALPGESFRNDAHRTAAAIRKLKDDYMYYGGDAAATAAAYIGGRGAVLPDGSIRADRHDAHGTTPVRYANMIMGRMTQVNPEDYAAIQAQNAPQATPDYSKDIDDIFNAGLDALNSQPKPVVKQSAWRRVGDAAIDVGKGIVDAGSTVMGLASLIPGVKQGLDAIGYDPQATNEILSDYYSGNRKQAETDIANARAAREGSGFLNEAGGAAMDLLRNPSVGIGRTIESVPSMLLGATGATGLANSIFRRAVAEATARGATAEVAAAYGRQVLAESAGALKTAGSIGEGVVSAGQTAQQVLQDNPNGNPYVALPAGVITGLISRGAGAIPGFGDAKTAMVTGVGAAGATGGMIKRGLKGGFSEGVLQEFPQGAQEQMWQNTGTGDPLMKGVGVNAGESAVLGFGLGAFEGGGHGGGPHGGPTSGQMLDNALFQAHQSTLYPLQADQHGQMDLLFPNQDAAPAVRPQDAAAGPLPPEAAPQQGEQLDLGLPQPEPHQLDMFGGPDQVPTQFDPRAGQPAPEPAQPQGTQLELPLNQPRADFQAEPGTPSGQPIYTGQEAPPAGQGGVVNPNNPSLLDMQMQARRKAAAGQLLNSFEAHLLTMPTPQANPDAQIEVPPASNVKQVQTQGDMFGAPLDQPAQKPVEQASPVVGNDPNQRELFDQRGQPAMGAVTQATGAEVAEQFGKEFKLKVTDQRGPLMAEVGRMYYDGKIDFDDAQFVAEQLRAGKRKAAEKQVAELTANASAQPEVKVDDVQQARDTNVAPPATPSTSPEPAVSVVGTPLEETHARNAEVIQSQDVAKAPVTELVSAAENGDHPHISSREAEQELARRFADGEGKEQAAAEKYFEDNFPNEKERSAYLRELNKDSLYKGMARYRQGDLPTGKNYVSPDDARAVVDATAGKWRGAPKIEVVENTGGLPADVRAQMEKDGANPKGVYKDGKVWIVSDNHTSTGDVLQTIMHEIAGHHGLRTLLGNDYAKTMNQIYNGNADIRKVADGRISEGLSKEVAVEEALAELAEKGLKPSVLEKIGNAIRSFLRSVGLGKFASGVTNAEVKELIAAARDRVKNGGPGAAAETQALYRTGAVPSLADMPEPAKATVMDKVMSALGGLGTSSGVLGLMTRRQLVDRFSDVPALKKLSNVVEMMADKAKTLQSEVAGIDKMFANLNDDEVKRVSEMMLEATINQYHVDLPMRDSLNEHVDPVMKQEFEALKAKYDALPQNLKDVYQAVKEKFKKDWDETNKLIKSRIIDQYREDLPGLDVDRVADISSPEDRIKFKKDLPVATRRLVSRLWDDMDNHTYTLKQMQGPYFPLMRFGDHVVVAKSEMLRNAMADLIAKREALSEMYRKDESEYTPQQLKDLRHDVNLAQIQVNQLKGSAKHYLVEFYEHKAEAEARERQIKELFKDDPSMKVERKLREAHFRELDSAPYGFMKKLQDEIAANLPDKDASAIKQAVRDLYIKQMPERAAMKQQLKRLTVRGVKAGEMRRAIISAGLRNSFNISRMMFAAPMNKSLGELRSGPTDTERLLGAEMAKRLVDTMTATPQNHVLGKMINGMSNLSYTTMLGLSPSFLLMNLTQPWTVSLPLLAARHGLGTSGREMFKATAEVAKLMGASWKEAREANGLKNSMHFEPDLSQIADAGERAMLDNLMKRGIIDVTQEHDLSAQSTGDTSGWTDKLASMSSIPAHHSEVVNRLATALAAYRMEKALDLKNGTDNATSYAEKIVADSHLDYTAENAPRLMRSGFAGGLGKLIFQFKKYQQGMIYLNFKLLRDSYKDGKLDKESAKAWTYLMAAQFGIAGLSGLPMAGVAAGLATVAAMFGADDEDKDLRLMFYNGLKDSLGETMARLVMKGAPAAFANLDVSNRAGMGDLLTPTKYARDSKNGQDWVANHMLALAGPAASLMANYYDGAKQVMHGDYRDAMRTIAPRFIQGPLDALSMTEQGLVTKRGNQYMKPEDLSAWDVAAKAATFTSTDMSDLSEAKHGFETSLHNRDAARHDLLNRYAKTALMGGEMDDIMEKIAAFNERHPERGVRIDQGTLVKARQAQKVYQRDLRNGIRVPKNGRSLADELGIK